MGKENLKNVFYGEGHNKGRRDEKIEIAKTMLEESPELGIEKISRITGLSIEEVEALKEEMTE